MEKTYTFKVFVKGVNGQKVLDLIYNNETKEKVSMMTAIVLEEYEDLEIVITKN